MPPRTTCLPRPLTIEGPTSGGITISGGLASGVILIGANGDVVLRNLSVVDGRDFFAPGISVGGKLVIDRVLVANNVGSTDTKSTGGGISVGNSGALTMVNSTVSGNLAWQGGGIYVGSGELTITSSTIRNRRSSV